MSSSRLEFDIMELLKKHKVIAEGTLMQSLTIKFYLDSKPEINYNGVMIK